jgi:hypothetical protein
MGGIRTIRYVSETYGHGQGTISNLARRHDRELDTVCIYGLLFFPAPGGVGKSRLGGELRREEQRYLRQGSAWIGTGPSTTYARVFSPAFPPISGTTGVAQEQRSGRPVESTDQLGC